MVVEGSEKHCPVCGKDVDSSEFRRFGEACCSEAHAEQYVKEVRGEKQAAAAAQAGPAPQAGSRQADVGRRRGGCC